MQVQVRCELGQLYKLPRHQPVLALQPSLTNYPQIYFRLESYVPWLESYIYSHDDRTQQPLLTILDITLHKKHKRILYPLHQRLQ